MKTNQRKILALIPLILAVILEILPLGAAIRTYTPSNGTNTQVFSYFSLTPYGYANFSPLIVGILSCVVLLMAVAGMFAKIPKKSVGAVSILAAVLSVFPAFMGCYNLFSWVITMLLAAWTAAFLIFVRVDIAAEE
jgi:hypothetical protein